MIEEVEVTILNEKQKQNLRVTKSNSLVNAHYDLNVTEMRILRFCISKIDSRQKTAPSKIKLYAKEYSEMFNCVNPYQDLKEATDKLFESEITYFDSERDKYYRTRWVQTALYEKNEGSVTLEFSTVVKKQLNDLTKNFTSYQIKHLGSLSSKYSIRLYELLYQYHGIGAREIEVKELREMFQLQEKYPLFSDFRKFVITKSIEEINNKTDLEIKVYTIKKGRSVTHIKFTIKRK